MEISYRSEKPKTKPMWSFAKMAQGLILVSALGCAGRQHLPERVPERIVVQRPSEAQAPRLEAGLERVFANADAIRRMAREGDDEGYWRLATSLIQCGSGCNRANFFRALEVARRMERRAQNDIDTGLNPDARINTLQTTLRGMEPIYVRVIALNALAAGFTESEIREAIRRVNGEVVGGVDTVVERILDNADLIRRLANEGRDDALWELVVGIIGGEALTYRDGFFEGMEGGRYSRSFAQNEIDAGGEPDARINSLLRIFRDLDPVTKRIAIAGSLGAGYTSEEIREALRREQGGGGQR